MAWSASLERARTSGKRRVGNGRSVSVIFAACRPPRKQPLRRAAPAAQRPARRARASHCTRITNSAPSERTRKDGEVIVLRRRDREWPIPAAISPARVAVFYRQPFYVGPAAPRKTRLPPRTRITKTYAAVGICSLRLCPAASCSSCEPVIATAMPSQVKALPGKDRV